jgi:hypothetical protein
MSLKIEKEHFMKVCEDSLSMAEASVRLKMHFNTFKKYAQLYGVYKPNPSGKGMSKKYNGKKIPLNEILDGKHPQYQTFKLKNRLISFGLKKNECEICGLDTWNGKVLNCELDHIDGNRTNHLLSNLRILCPNCHSQTETYRSKNKI